MKDVIFNFMTKQVIDQVKKTLREEGFEIDAALNDYIKTQITAVLDDIVAAAEEGTENE